MTNFKTVAVLAISAGTVAFSSWYVYKTYKRVKSEMEEQRILDSKVNAEIEKHENAESIEAYNEIVKVTETRQETIDKEFESKVEAAEKGEEHFDDSDELLYMMNEEEEEKLLHDTNSQAAMGQFIGMELSDIEDANVLKVMDELFKIGIDLSGGPDEIVQARLVENRANFFGVSKWTEDVSIADLLINFARLEAFDMDADIEHTLLVYLENLGIYDATEPLKFDINRLNVQAFLAHEWAYEGMLGMFGLDEHEAWEVLVDQERVTGRQQSTFQGQYNKHMEALLG